MIRQITIFTLIFITAQFFFACYNDESKLDINKVPGVTIDTTGMSTLSVYRFNNLVVKPNVITDLDAGDLSYEWKISLDHNKAEFEILSNEKDLDAQINIPPTQDAWVYDYQLCYTVTDISRDLKYIMNWKIKVKNSLGEGLVIAYSDDNTTTDLSLIMCPEVTIDYDKDDVKRNIFSIANGYKIDGIVKKMLNTQIYRYDGVFAITDNSILTIKKEDYTKVDMNDELFHNHPAPFKPQNIFRTPMAIVYVNNNEITGTIFTSNPKFGLPKYSDFITPDKIAYSLSQSSAIAFTYYDETNNCFVYLSSFAPWIPFKYAVVPNGTDYAFNSEDLPNKVNLAAGYNIDGEFLHLLKDTETGNINLYKLSNANPPVAKNVYDFSDATDIENAEHFVFSPDNSVMYYATDNKIYAVLYGGSEPVYSLKYTAPAGEEITTLQMFIPSEYPFASSDLTTTYKQLIMSTYSSEGKVYIMPLINLGSGNIDVDNIKVFDGFGKISNIAHQK